MPVLKDIPGEVITKNVLPFLKLNDLLRLRRVCKKTKPLAEAYLALAVTTGRTIDVSLDPEEPKNLEDLLDLSFKVPTSSFYIQNKENGHQIWDLEEMMFEFVELYGEKITHLRLDTLEIPLSAEASAFLDMLPKLEHLRVHTVYKGEEGVYIPRTFKQLKSFSVNEYRDQNDSNLFLEFFELCSPRLELVSHTHFLTNESGSDALVLKKLMSTLLHIDREKTTLRAYDLQQVFGAVEDYELNLCFFYLVYPCCKHNVKLENVDSKLIFGVVNHDFNHVDYTQNDFKEKLGNVIVSLQFLHAPCFLLELPKLEKVIINDQKGRGVSWCTMPAGNFERKMWPSLKEIDIFVDKPEIFEFLIDDFMIVPTSRLLDYFFVGIRRDKMDTLKLGFSRVEEDLPCPRTRDIWESCPNLTKLSLYFWLGTNNALSKLWGHLPLLKELKLECCCALANVAFVGKDIEDPTFFKLTNLRKLTLCQLNSMPKITDTLFSHVLRKMPLKELYLDGPDNFERRVSVKHITVVGIQSLLTGKFAESVERFPLEGHLKLEGVSAEGMFALERQFRSSRML